MRLRFMSFQYFLFDISLSWSFFLKIPLPLIILFLNDDFCNPSWNAYLLAGKKWNARSSCNESRTWDTLKISSDIYLLFVWLTHRFIFFLFHICSSSYICTTFYYKSSFHATKLHTITFLAWNLRWHGWLMHTCHGIDTKFMMQLEMNNMAWIYFGTRNGISILFYFLPQRLTKRRRQQQSFFMLLLLCHKMLLLNYLSLYFYK